MSLPVFDVNIKRVADSGAALDESNCIDSFDPKSSCEQRIKRRYIILALILTTLSVVVLVFALSFSLIQNGDSNKSEDEGSQIFIAPILPPYIVCDAFYCSAVEDDLFGEEVSPDCDCSSFTNGNASTFSTQYSVESTNSLFDCIDHPTVCTNNTIRSFVSTEPGNPQQNFKPSHMKTLPDQPIPTNAWWGNLVDPFPTDGDYKSYPVFPHPYMLQYKFHSNDFTDSSSTEDYLYGVHLSHLPPYRIFGPTPESGKGSANGTLYMYHWYTTDIIVSALDIVHQGDNDASLTTTSTSNADYSVTDWDRDGFGVTVRIDIESEESSSDKFMQTTLVQGMAMVTTEYENCIPSIQLGHTVSIIYESDANDKWIVEMDITHYNDPNVTKQHWVIYADPPIEWKQEELLKGQKWSAMTESYSGVVRMAKLPDKASEILANQVPIIEKSSDPQILSPAYNLFDPYRNCIVNGGAVHVPIAETIDNQQTYMIQWHTASPCPNGVLHYGLPHQESMIQLYQKDTFNDGSSTYSDSDTVAYQNFRMESPSRGFMQAYVSLSGIWRFQVGVNTMKSYTDNEYDVRGVFLPETILTTVEEVESIDLITLLHKEIVLEDWNVPIDGSYYFNGKAAQKYATLCMLANQTLAISRMNSDIIGHWNSSALEGLFHQCMSQQGSIMDTFIDNQWAYPLVYDEVYKGIVSSQGYVDVNNTFADFGNTVYNDHHYHWGYWVVASSIYLQLSQYEMSSSASIFQSSRKEALINMVNGLIRDVVNPAPNDVHFPMYRHFNWFYGHSLANGIFPSIDGKNEESISEEMNFHYGIYLWGYVTRNSPLEHLGQLMMDVNAHSIQTYFLFTNDNPVHPLPLRSNKVAGIMFDSKVQYDTWFSDLPECIHGIQMLPVSPITSKFRSKQFIQEEWNEVLSKIPVYDENPTSSWISLIYVNLAQVDASMALSKLRMEVTNFDGGLSRSWALYYVATYLVEQRRTQMENP